VILFSGSAKIEKNEKKGTKVTAFFLEFDKKQGEK
jgi:hypothetical protein